MQISYLTDEALATLRGQLPDNIECYASGDLDFFYDILESINGIKKDTTLVFPDFTLDETSDYSISDMYNVRTLYTAMRTLPPAVACDERLWVALAHGFFWDYVQYRQADQIASREESKIATSFFFTNGHRRSLYVNCLSRLWWAGHLTYDEANKEDPFALTDLITKRAFPSTITLFSSSNMTANPNIGLGVLDSIKKRELAGEEIERKHFVGPLRYLNSMGGITVLDVFSRQEITSIIDKYLASEDFKNLKLKSKKKKSEDKKANSPSKDKNNSSTKKAMAKEPRQTTALHDQPKQPATAERYIEPLTTIHHTNPAPLKATAKPVSPPRQEVVAVYDPVIENLEAYGFEYVDQRPEGGALWVVAGKDFEGVAEYWRDQSIIFEYTEHGGKAVDWRPSWWTNDESPE